MSRPWRAFYLDLAQWAIEDPARWGRWVAPCPVGEEEVNQRKAARRRKARMDARTRERLPVLPVLVRTVDQRRKTAAALLAAARQTRPGQAFTFRGQTLIRSITSRPTDKIWVDDPGHWRLARRSSSSISSRCLAIASTRSAPFWYQADASSRSPRSSASSPSSTTALSSPAWAAL